MINKVIAKIFLLRADRYGEQGDLNCKFHLLLKAAKLGDIRAQNNVGCAYLEGKGIEKDMSQARYWFRTSAEQGHEESLKIMNEYDSSQNQ